MLASSLQDGRQSMQSHVVDLEDGVAQELLGHHEEEFHDGHHADGDGVLDEGRNDQDGCDSQEHELAAIADGRSTKDVDSSEKEVGDKIIKSRWYGNM
jgi:hypothetical protein